MRNNPIYFALIFSAIILAIDFYVFRGVKKLIIDLGKSQKKIIKILFWVIPVILIAGIFLVPALQERINPAEFIIYFHFLSGTFILFYIPKLIFIGFNFIDDIFRLSVNFISKIKKQNPEEVNSQKISRSKFLTQVGIITAGIPFVSLIYGIGWGRFNITVRNEKIFSSKIPKNFNGLKIVQLSDFHIGSMLNQKDFVEEIVQSVNSLNPDLFLFTGDMVNNISEEMDSFLEILSKLKAKYGKYSILGNHDYGEYFQWKSEMDRLNNLERLKQLQKNIGLDLLLNENRKIEILGESIELMGVENWGLPPFPQYGNLKKAMENVDENKFKILMSHDPTHWDEQVLGYTNIDLTLSGHTHGAQFGIEIPGWRWSPVNMRYKRWGGIYSENEQQLYVNTGIGYIGFPGRVGMPPEITVIELNSKIS
ncbi:MAG: metallophosphoesterase [Ignavibacteriae bacterium]|nr:metallophosphoesterase [Ignavibacteriota bacterium]